MVKVWSMNLLGHDEDHAAARGGMGPLGAGVHGRCPCRIPVGFSRSCTIRNVAMMAGMTEFVLVAWAVCAGFLGESVAPFLSSSKPNDGACNQHQMGLGPAARRLSWDLSDHLSKTPVLKAACTPPTRTAQPFSDSVPRPALGGWKWADSCP